MGDGSKITRRTFKGWNVEGPGIGYEEKAINDTPYVYKVWCNICRQHEKELLRDGRCRGIARKAMRSYFSNSSPITRLESSRRVF